MTDVNMDEIRKSKDPAIIPVLCNIIDKMALQIVRMQRNPRESSNDGHEDHEEDMK